MNTWLADGPSLAAMCERVRISRTLASEAM
jgi:hypothetical protein